MEWIKRLKVTVWLSTVLLFAPSMVDAASANDSPLIPMGHSIGIKMDLSGIFVTNDVLIEKDRWLKAGDLITKLGDVPVARLDELEKTLKNAKEHEAILVHVLRGAETFQYRTDRDAVKRLIPFLKDQTEGTGTLTYVDPQKGTYGALGHQIIDSSLNSPPTFKKGEIYLSEIGQIRKSSPGNPGYKISSIVESEPYMGTIEINGLYGIFGSWNKAHKEAFSEPLDIIQPNNLKIGAAELYTTVKGTRVESFSIRITKIEKHQFQFVLTDSKLLKETGGILQGMSGSPIIQDGKFAGAVTHMFVDEPERGSALFISTMRTGEK